MFVAHECHPRQAVRAPLMRVTVPARSVGEDESGARDGRAGQLARVDGLAGLARL
jgi:hypothetical protein